jgi:hypothetical protein
MSDDNGQQQIEHDEQQQYELENPNERIDQLPARVFGDLQCDF